MQFHVRALSPDNLMSDITVHAPGEGDARRQVEARGLFAIEVKAAPNSIIRNFARAGAQRSGFSLILFSQELLALLQAGLSLVEGLEALQEKEASQSSGSVITHLLKGLREGKRFSGVLSEQAEHFPPLYIGIIKAAEGTSDLPRALARYIDYRQKVDLVRNKIVSASIYPLILLMVGGGVSLFLMTYVVPKFAAVYQGAGRELPWMSQLLLEWGNFSSIHGKPLLLVAAFFVFSCLALIRHLEKKGGISLLVSSLPGIKGRARIFQLSRLYLTLGMLLEGGVPIVTAMKTVEDMVSPGIRKNLRAARQLIESGSPVSSAFERQQLTTPISVRMLRVGERSGELGSMLTQSAAFYDGEISRWIDRFTRSFEPLLMAAIGIIVGAIVVLLYMPIFDLAGSLS
ncbi:type II secretion system F family protein [Undibacterium sp.]|jgi:general secretion pathway protein F|uniref:type II secretion system F family protein n=1 Tax=Undibacterium sp. TaxID=1914977 RepID=UPI002B53F944|nr:type II secretion system F family protein [Undibacterium sp.]HTD05062.1 type II secretion system F family protein [Undibacterium sp.]